MPQCAACANWRPGQRACEAYPDGIPDEIWNNQVDHREPYEGDDGIQWEPFEGAEFPEWALSARDVQRADIDDEDEGESEEDDVERAAGHDTTPGNDELHHFWTKDPEGLGQWRDSPKPWTTLVALLAPHVGPLKAKVFASRWFIEVFGYAAGSDLNRVAHGKPPRGDVVGPG